MIKINGNYIKKEYDEMGNVEITFSFQHFYDKKKADELKEGLYCLEIKKPKSKRSLNQNAYMWAIIHEIAQELQQDDMEIYISVSILISNSLHQLSNTSINLLHSCVLNLLDPSKHL